MLLILHAYDHHMTEWYNKFESYAARQIFCQLSKNIITQGSTM